jgi:hypothetical protein
VLKERHKEVRSAVTGAGTGSGTGYSKYKDGDSACQGVIQNLPVTESSPPQAAAFQGVRLGRLLSGFTLTSLPYRRQTAVMDVQEHRLTIRLSTAVVAALKGLAKAHSRSLNGEVDWAVRELREYIAQQKRKRKAEQ